MFQSSSVNKLAGHGHGKKAKSKGLLSTGDFKFETGTQRLPSNVVPSHYTMCIKPNISTLESEGCVAINCEVCQIFIIKFSSWLTLIYFNAD